MTVKKVEEMTPEDHLDRAQVLVQTVDAKFNEYGTSEAVWAMRPVALDLADTHLMLADLKREFNR